MQLKMNLHFHTADDPMDIIDYSLNEGIDTASSLNFEVIALTCHHEVKWTREYSEYAKYKNILLIPGVEIDIKETKSEKGKHLVILNCDKEAEKIKNFDDLKKYKELHPEIFVLFVTPWFFSDRRHLTLLLLYLLTRHFDQNLSVT